MFKLPQAARLQLLNYIFYPVALAVPILGINYAKHKGTKVFEWAMFFFILVLAFASIRAVERFRALHEQEESLDALLDKISAVKE